jgi:hypothetical protein
MVNARLSTLSNGSIWLVSILLDNLKTFPEILQSHGMIRSWFISDWTHHVGLVSLSVVPRFPCLELLYYR